MFDDCKTTTNQGDIGEARAIYEYIKLGYVVSKPLNDKAKYDLIIDKDEKLLKVQVKTASALSGKNKDIFKVKICSSYSNKNISKTTPRQDTDYDILFVLTSSDEVWSIPVDVLDSRTQVNIGGTKYQQYKL